MNETTDTKTANPFKGLTYAQSLDFLAERHGDREALVFRGKRWTFREAREEIDRASRRLATLGLKRGDTVAIWMQNRPEYLWYWFGASQMGLLTVFLNTRLKRDEFMYQLGQSENRALITSGDGYFRDFIGELTEACPDLRGASPVDVQLKALPRLRHVIALDPVGADISGVMDWSAPTTSLSTAPPREEDPDRPALIGYSSGTTALPKGAMLTHCIWRKAFDGGERMGVNADDRLFLCVPLFGVLGFLNGALMFWVRGACLVLEERFEVESCIRLLEEERCTCIHQLPAMIDALAAHPDFDRDKINLRAGVVLSNDPDVLRKAALEIGVVGVVTGYGMTESTGLVTRVSWTQPLEERLKSQGWPLPDCLIRVVDPETGEDMPAGEQGEIWIGGYSVMAGYYNKPKETKDTITPDGWLRSGDAGVLNADGTLNFRRRLKDGYKHKGFNVSTPEIQAVIMKHDAVAESAVVGIPDEKFGEKGVAFIVPKKGAKVAPEEIGSFVSERLASFKVPSHFALVDALPRTGGTDKIQIFKVKEMALEKFGGAQDH